MKFDLVILPGDGVGPEVMAEAMKVISVINSNSKLFFNTIKLDCGRNFYLNTGKCYSSNMINLCRSSDAILFGAVDSIPSENITTKNKKVVKDSAILTLRKELDLFANVRPIKMYNGIKHKVSGNFQEVWKSKNVDYVIVRENTEEAYFGDEIFEKNSVSNCLKITKEATDRIVYFAYNLSRKRCSVLNKITCVDKSNVLSAHKFFRDIFIDIGCTHFDKIERSFFYVDAFTLFQNSNPEMLDVVLAPNMVGDIISDCGSIAHGGLGMSSSANIGKNHALFEPVHGTAPSIASKDIANPIGMIRSIVLMLEWLYERNKISILLRAAKGIDNAIQDAVNNSVLTCDLVKSGYSCSEVGTFIANRFHKIFNG